MAEKKTSIVVIPNTGNKGGYIAAGAGALIIVGAAAYTYTQYQAYVKGGGTLSFWSWLTQGGNNNVVTPPPSALTPTLKASSTNITTADQITLTGTGYTPNSTMTITSVPVTTTSTHSTAGDGSFTTGSFSASAITNVGGTFTFTGHDSTGITSNSVTVTIAAPTTPTPTPTPTPMPTPTTDTTQPGYAISPSLWTQAGPYGSNTNPVSWGNWVVSYGTYYGVNFSWNSGNGGYFQNNNGTAEMYFATPSAATAWLQSNGFPTTSPAPSGNQTYSQGELPSNPFTANSNGTLPLPPSVPNPAYQNGLYWYIIPGTSTAEQCSSSYIVAYNSDITTVTSTTTTTQPSGNSTQTIGGYTFNSYTNTSSNMGTLADPYVAWIGYVGPGYYVWVVKNLEYASQITSQSMFNAINAVM